MDRLARFKLGWVQVVGLVVGVAYLAAWVWAGWNANYPAVLILLRTGLIMLALVLMTLGVWWLRHGGKVRMSTVVFGAPLVVAVIAVPLPYYLHGKSLEHSLQRAGVQYRLQANGFSQTLNHFTNDLFGLHAVDLFASDVTILRVDLANSRQDALLKIPSRNDLQVVFIDKTHAKQLIEQDTIQWIQSLPDHTRINFSLYQIHPRDVQRLKSLDRRLESIRLFGDPIDATALVDVLACDPNSLDLSSINFKNTAFEKLVDNHSPPLAPTHLSAIRVAHCDLTPAQLIKLAEISGCETLNVDCFMLKLNVNDCRQLANLPKLKNLFLASVRLSFAELEPLMASPQLTRFAADGASNVNATELERLRELIPPDANRRLRVDFSPGIYVGDLGFRRGQ